MMTLDLASVPQYIAELGLIDPTRLALRDHTVELNYGELSRRAACLAAYLGLLGLKPGGTVALCLERSADWIIVALAIMRAGAAYVPLDESWPSARLQQALIDAEATIIVARESRLQTLVADGLRKMLMVDPVRDAAAINRAGPAPAIALPPESLAYVIFTSGSSGTPKGVEITHGNLNHLIRWHRDTFRMTRRDRATHLLGLGFDACVMETWAPLAAGAALCLAPEPARSSPELLQQWIVREGITVSHVPTSLGQRLIQMEWPEEAALRLLIIGGDTLRQYPARHIAFEVVNNYGPTEATVSSTWARLRPGQSGKPSIGKPAQGTSVYVLDEQGCLVAAGQAGEIYIGGGGVGRGYRNLPGLTAKNFVPDPFAGIDGARMYRTGDRGTWRSDGQLDFCGRLDRQIKLRGFRVELDEISAVLGQHPRVEFCFVVTRTSPLGENQLLAYVLPAHGAKAPTRHELQQHLLRSLPEYMVPSVFMRLDTLPLSANGKVDVARLEHAASGNVLERIEAREATSPLELRMLRLMQQVLNNDAVGRTDNFFLVGGHSLLGMQLLMNLRTEFGVELSLRQLFEAPSVEQLATMVGTVQAQERVAEVWTRLLGPMLVDLDGNFFSLGGKAESLAPLQQALEAEFHHFISTDQLLLNPTIRQQAKLLGRLVDAHPALPPGVLALQPKGTRSSIFWIHYFNANLAKLVGEDQPFLVVRLMVEDFALLGEAPTLQQIAACHVHKILLTQPEGPYTVGGLCLGAILAFEIAHQLKAGGHEVSLVVMLDPPSPSHLDSPRRLGPKLSQPAYLLKRAARLGARTSMRKLRQRLFPASPPSSPVEVRKSEVELAQDVIELAATAYHPEPYHGSVLMLLASERPPHLDFLPGWQALVPDYLHAHYLDGHHEELTRGLSGQRVAEAIFSHLASAMQRDAIAS